MIIPAGLRLQLIGVVDNVEDLRTFEPLEVGIAQRELIQFQVDGDPFEIAAAIEAQLSTIPTWPEFSTHTFVDGSVVSIAYYTTGFEPQIGWIVPILGLIVVPIIGSVLLYFLSETYRDLINSMVSMLIMILVLSVMTKLTKFTSGKQPPGEQISGEKKLPFEQRVLNRIESVATSIASIRSAFVTSPSSASSKVVGAAESLSSLARLVRKAPETAMDTFSKEKASREITKLSRRLDEYETRLTPDQRLRLDQEQGLVQDILRGG